MGRHRWGEPKGGWMMCARCGTSAKEYQVKKGGLPPCPGAPTAAKQLKLDEIGKCRYHDHGLKYLLEIKTLGINLMGNTTRCLACGKIYTDQEKVAFALNRRGQIEAPFIPITPR